MFGNALCRRKAPPVAVPSANPYTRVRASGSRAGTALDAASHRSVDTDECTLFPRPSARRSKASPSTTSTRSSTGRAFMSGMQALVRLPMLQRKRDAMFGLNTAGFISGYRGSPLGGYDQALWAGEEAPRGAEHRLPARRQRGARRRPRSGARSSSTSIRRRRSSTACSASGTARARASTAAPTSSSTPTSPAPRSTAA